MMDVMPSYFEKSDAFFKAILDAHAEKEFVAMMSARADKVARDICLATEDRITDILKGQLSICYELADGVRQALTAREEKANSEREGGPLDEP